MSESKKPILCLDFDGVIHSYKSGWQGATNIPDPPVPGAFEFMREASQHFKICIFSSRSNEPGGILAMKLWLSAKLADAGMTDKATRRTLHKGLEPWALAIEWPTVKLPAKVTIDDRALTFTGTWPSIESLVAFKPWNMNGGPGQEYYVRRSDQKTTPRIELCHCDLSGEAHVIIDGDHCEVCRTEERVPFTPENVAKFFKGLEARMTALQDEYSEQPDRQ